MASCGLWSGRLRRLRKGKSEFGPEEGAGAAAGWGLDGGVLGGAGWGHEAAAGDGRPREDSVGPCEAVGAAGLTVCGESEATVRERLEREGEGAGGAVEREGAAEVFRVIAETVAVRIGGAVVGVRIGAVERLPAIGHAVEV